MPVIKKEELKRLIDENNLKTIDDIGNLLTQLEKEMIEEVLQGELDSHLGYSKYDYEHKNTENSRIGITCRLLQTKSSMVLFIFNNLEKEVESYLYFEEKFKKLRIIFKDFSDLKVLSEDSINVHMGPKEVVILELL
jgi:hypothetical protein